MATPLIFLILGSFSEASLLTQFTLSELTLRNYRQVWFDPDTYLVFYNTLIYVTGATAFGISVAAELAWLVERTDIPGKIWILRRRADDSSHARYAAGYGLRAATLAPYRLS